MANVRRAALALLLAAAACSASDPFLNGPQGPSFSFGPGAIDYAVMNYADPPPANPPPVPQVVWATAEEGLSHRNYRPRPATTTSMSARAKRDAARAARAGLKGAVKGAPGGAAGAPGAAGAGVPGAAGAGAPGAQGAGAAAADESFAGLMQRRLRSLKRSLKATPFRSAPPPGAPGAGNATSNVGAPSGRTDASGKHGSGYGFGGIGLSRKITGQNLGFDGIGVPETRLIPEDLSLAVGNTAAIHTANSLIRFYRVDITGKKGKHGIKDPVDSGSFLKQVWLPDFFYPVTKRPDGSNGCDMGVFSAAVAYDKWVGRYMISAICDDWLNPRILLAVSTVDSVTDFWTQYAVDADNIPTSWKCANGRRAYPDYSQVGYNRDGVYVTWVAICREEITSNDELQSSAMIYAFPKWAIYGGNNPDLPLKRFNVPVFTGQDLCLAVRDQAPFRLPEGGDCGSAFIQLQPAMPQTAMDVRAGETFFVLDFFFDQMSRRNFLLVSLIATGTLWDHDGIGTPSPYIVGRFVDRGEEAYVSEDVYLLQDQGAGVTAPDLDAGAVNPRGYWNGGAAFANSRIYIADRTDIEDPPAPPGSTTDIYNPRPGIYWAWVQPTFTAYGPCACYWNFNWGYGYGWIWDKGCYNPVTGVFTAGGGGRYSAGSGGRKLLAEAGVIMRPAAFAMTPAERDRSTVIPYDNSTAAPGAAGQTVFSSGSSGGSWAEQSAAPRQRTPNVVYSAAAGAVEHTIRTQAPRDSRVVIPPSASEVAAASLRPEAVTQEVFDSAEQAASKGPGSWVSVAQVSASGGEAHKYRDVYMAAAYYQPSGWAVDIRCRFDFGWNVKNKVTLLATVIKSGVITHGSAAGQADVPLGLAYPQVAVRGGSMLVTYTFSSFANLPAQTTAKSEGGPAPRVNAQGLSAAQTSGGYVPGTMYPDSPAYAGVGFTVINPEDPATQVNIAWQNDPSYGPIVQTESRFGDYAGIDIHPISGRIWSANLAVWAPAWTVDGATVISNAGARITIFS